MNWLSPKLNLRVAQKQILTPGLVQMVPPGVPVDKILEAMQWMNSELAGNLAARKQWRMMQSFSGSAELGPKDELEQLKEPILADVGTAPGLTCPVGDKVIYAVPGVPSEMREMLERSVLPDLVRRSGEKATIRSRFLRVWGMTESKVAETVAPISQ